METNTGKSREIRIRLTRRFLAIVLVIAVLLAGGYLGLSSYNDYMIQRANSFYILGYNDGLTASVQNILVQSDNCQPVPVFYGNFTRNLIDTACLQAAE